VTDSSIPQRVQERFEELKNGARKVICDPDNPQIFIDLSLEKLGIVWLVKVQTNEFPSKALAEIGAIVDKINKEEDFTLNLTLESPRSRRKAHE